MKIYIKNMVCNRCIMVVKTELEKLGFHPVNLSLGKVTLEKELNSKEKDALQEAIVPLGFQLIDDKKSRIIEQVKNVIINLVHYEDNDAKTNLSDILSEKLNHDYNYLSNLFSEVESTTIEKFYIAHKVEKIKELLVYDELSLTEIAFQLNYSSVAYLSNQFKKVTGLTPSHFKKIRENKRSPLVLDEGLFKEWFNDGLTESHVTELMENGFTSKEFKAHPVSRDLYKRGVDTNTESMLQRVAPESLF